MYYEECIKALPDSDFFKQAQVRLALVLLFSTGQPLKTVILLDKDFLSPIFDPKRPAIVISRFQRGNVLEKLYFPREMSKLLIARAGDFELVKRLTPSRVLFGNRKTGNPLGKGGFAKRLNKVLSEVGEDLEVVLTLKSIENRFFD